MQTMGTMESITSKTVIELLTVLYDRLYKNSRFENDNYNKLLLLAKIVTIQNGALR